MLTKFDGCPNPGGVQGQVEQDPGQPHLDPNLVFGNPVCDKLAGTR